MPMTLPTLPPSSITNKQAANTRDGFGRVVRFNPPTIVNGKVYVAGLTQFSIFGLLP